jgi:ribose 5-phosphate isomerase B
VDYPDFGDKVSSAVSKGEVDRGVLICGTGIGMSIVANKHRNVRAALCSEPFSARMSRLHNDANVLVLGGRVVGSELAKDIARVWMETPFEGGRHLRRLQKISSMEEKRDKTKE